MRRNYPEPGLRAESYDALRSFALLFRAQSPQLKHIPKRLFQLSAIGADFLGPRLPTQHAAPGARVASNTGFSDRTITAPRRLFVGSRLNKAREKASIVPTLHEGLHDLFIDSLQLLICEGNRPGPTFIFQFGIEKKVSPLNLP